MGNLASAIDELAACDVDAMPGPVLLAEITELLRQRDGLNAVYLRMLERADRTGAVLTDHGAHHRIHWANGGPTSVTNGTLLCGRHHDRVHLHGHAIIHGPGRYGVDLRPGSDPHWHGPPHRAGP